MPEHTQRPLWSSTEWGSVRTYFCMIVCDRFHTMVENLTNAMPYVDEIIVVDGGSTDGTLEWLAKNPKIHVINFPWCDDFAASRNQYLNKIAELRAEDELSIYVRADDDEFFSYPVLEHLKDIMADCWSMGFNQARVRVKDVVLDRRGQVVSAEIGEFRKPLIHTWQPGMRYVGEVHEALVSPEGANQVDLLDHYGQFIYEHRKQEYVWWPRGLRNFFLKGGGVPPQADRQELWLDFRKMITKYGDFPTYRHFEKYLSGGNIAPEIKDWFITHRKYGLPSYDAKYTEIREGFLTYFLWFHPEELPAELIEQDKEYMNYLAEIKKIHGEDWSR